MKNWNDSAKNVLHACGQGWNIGGWTLRVGGWLGRWLGSDDFDLSHSKSWDILVPAFLIGLQMTFRSEQVLTFITFKVEDGDWELVVVWVPG